MADSASHWHRISALDAALTLRCNRVAHHHAVARFFGVVSRLGDGLLWYAVMLMLPPWLGARGLDCSLRMLAAGVAGLAVYKVLKRHIARPRPCEVHHEIRARVPALDTFSFPSGHTLHAVSFAWVAAGCLPEIAVPLIVFALLVAASRPILGLHYPSDVLAGAGIGAALAQSVLML